jgi:choline dehydrogenase-like flavoprotein
MSAREYDYLIVGSGFGGGVSALRTITALAERAMAFIPRRAELDARGHAPAAAARAARETTESA